MPSVCFGDLQKRADSVNKQWVLAKPSTSSGEDTHNRYSSLRNYHKQVSFPDTTFFKPSISTPFLSSQPSPFQSSSKRTLIFLFLQLKHPCLDFLCPFLDFCTTSSECDSDSWECSLLWLCSVEPFLDDPDFSDSALRFLTNTNPDSLVESETSVKMGECRWLESDPEFGKKKSISELPRSRNGSLSQSSLILMIDSTSMLKGLVFLMLR